MHSYQGCKNPVFYSKYIIKFYIDPDNIFNAKGQIVFVPRFLKQETEIKEVTTTQTLGTDCMNTSSSNLEFYKNAFKDLEITYIISLSWLIHKCFSP